MSNYKAASKSYTSKQLAEYLFEDRFANHTIHIKQNQYDKLVSDFVESCTTNLTKTEIVTILENVEYGLEPEIKYDK